MSLITRCPACGTMFKVVPDQLRISEGWVRCGHCSDVFDARAHLQADVAEAPDVRAQAQAPEATAADEADLSPSSEAFPSSLITEIGEGLPSQGPDSAQLEAEEQALREHPLDQPFELRREDVPAPDSAMEDDAKPLPWVRPGRRPVTEPESNLQDDSELHDDVSFVQQARRRAFWSRPGVRAGLIAALLALGLLLALQVALHDRDRLAAADPKLQPWLVALCQTLNCTVRPPRQIDAISIDSSSFSKLRSDVYRLSITLKNQAAMEVAIPAIELTLTDAQDQPVVRRVLTPAELGANSGVLPPTSDWSASLALAVAANGNGSRISGYRLLAFYP